MNLQDQNKQKKHSASAAIHKGERTGSCAAARLVLLGLVLEIKADDTDDLWGGTSTVCYDADKKTYWVIGIRGLGLESFKKKGKTVKKGEVRYFSWIDVGPYAEKTIGNKTTRISTSAYYKKQKQIFKKDSLKLQSISYSDLCSKLDKLSSE